ncbi:reticulon-1-A [Drosophila biarmipes]|uniref:reticulon-1-A n=1 Tax=Drosophila biarmipes TaxID=125945 RepID=UPI0007E770AC|nr:reticulon-1-A [Drosophila biarmipes]
MDSRILKKDDDSSQLLLSLKDLLLWRNCRITLIVFTSILLLLLDVTVHSVISVVSMAGITILLAAFGHRLLMQLLKAWKKEGSHDQSLRLYAQVKIEIPREDAIRLAGKAVHYLNSILNRMMGLFLVEKLEDSLKLFVLLCGINLLGDCFNGLTLILIGHVFIFTLPKLYASYKPIIDVQVRKFRKCKQKEDDTPETKGEKSEYVEEVYPTQSLYENQDSNEGSMLYKVCDNEQLLDLLEAEHRKGCRCRDCEHQELPVEVL